MLTPSDAADLPGGGAMPYLGFGTWQIVGDAAYRAVADALEVGYRHLDTATMYRNEAEVGRALRASGVERDAVFVTTKVPGNATEVRPTIERSLTALGLEDVDLWLLHWPPSRSYEPAALRSAEMVEEMLAARADGLVRAVGVSNFSIAEIDELVRHVGDVPAVNQIEWSPFLHDAAVRAAHDARRIVLEGYSPFQASNLEHPVLREVGDAHGVTTAQVILRWHLQHRVVVIPKSAHRERIAENFAVFGFALTEAEMARLDALGPSSSAR